MSWLSKQAKTAKTFMKYPAAPGLGTLGKFLDAGTTTVDQKPFLLPEQQAALAQLADFAKTGKWGDPKNPNTAGEAYTGPALNFDMTATEKLSQDKLNELISGGNGPLYDAGKSTLMSFLNTAQFDPFNPKGEYAGFQKQAYKDLQTAIDKSKQSRAYAGSLFNRASVKENRLLNENVQDALQSKLASLYSQFVQNKLSAAWAAANYEQTGQNMTLARLGAGYQFGNLPRTLANASAEDKKNEWLRRRTESLMPMATSSEIYSTNPQWGIPSITTPNTSPWQNILELVAKGGGAYLGAKG